MNNRVDGSRTKELGEGRFDLRYVSNIVTFGSQPRFIISETGNSPNNRERVARPGSGRETISALAKSYFRGVLGFSLAARQIHPRA